MSAPIAAAVGQLRADGFAVVSGVVTHALLEDLRAEAAALVAAFDDGHRSDNFWHFTRKGDSAPVLFRIHNLQQQPGAPLAAELFATGPLHHLAERLLGQPARARVIALIVKMPHVAAAVPWHRDRVDAPAGSAINLSLFLDDSDADNGCLEFVPGSHLLADEAVVDQVCTAGPVVPVAAKAGDVAVHDVRVVHASRPNPSARTRRSLVIEFALATEST
ncbi:phytanoyl-CoA dioxygenase family protein [Streptomyces sp. NBC_00102]|uniref:phytanoyl-CoA dioxygenase family protein n=1 Tax=Streptomyces sp. NBC_00102 TaxID=2975652 RepID=UPI00225BFFA4|nr:phytanoyl-CoA dioxygenase family protein [Streptomyces sp. NBC_00102]MCX5397195.1 phytanoyl-CoA dioxygenase family protein [Streptomyces sp. NBC_00102]